MAMLHYKALFAFAPEAPDELRFDKGDTIEASAAKLDAEWGTGTNIKTGGRGTFPWNYLSPTGVPADPALPPRPGTAGHQYQNFSPTGVTGAPPLQPRGESVSMQRQPVSQAGTSPRSPSVSSGAGAALFKDKPWYGGAMKRDAVQRVLENAADGTFLVRDSTSREGFSLSVKFQDIRHIVIMCRGGKYGFSEPTEFDSVLALVEYFQATSLAHYNAELETTLAYPFREAPTAVQKQASVMLGDEDEEELYITNRNELRNQLGAKKVVHMRDTDDEGIYVQMKAVEVEHKAHSQMLVMLKDHKELQRRMLLSASLQPADDEKLQQNRKNLGMRLTDSERNLNVIESKVAQAREAASKRTQSVSGGRGRNQKLIVDAKIDRVKAEGMLAGQADGTFIIRKSNRALDPYTLSMNFQSKARHIQIKYDGTRYGLAEPLAFYSLEDLIKYYKDTELSSTITKQLTTALNQFV